MKLSRQNVNLIQLSLAKVEGYEVKRLIFNYG